MDLTGNAGINRVVPFLKGPSAIGLHQVERKLLCNFNELGVKLARIEVKSEAGKIQGLSLPQLGYN